MGSPQYAVVRPPIILAAACLITGYLIRRLERLTRERHIDHSLAGRVAQVNQLQFSSVERNLTAALTPAEYVRLREMLLRDYQVLLSLLRYGAEYHGLYHTVEIRLLQVAFGLFYAGCLMLGPRHPGWAGRSLYQMAEILREMSDVLGARHALPV